MIIASQKVHRYHVHGTVMLLNIPSDIVIHYQINCGEIARVFSHPFPIFIHLSVPPSFLLPLTEYLELDHQLDQLDAALEDKRGQLHRDAKQLLADARSAWEQSSEM